MADNTHRLRNRLLPTRSDRHQAEDTRDCDFLDSTIHRSVPDPTYFISMCKKDSLVGA
jgi:hypothetical protein